MTRPRLPGIAALMLWSLFVLLALLLIQQSPPWQRLQTLSIQLDPGESVVLGRTELAAAAAAPRHIRISRDQTRWWIENIATEHRLLVRKEHFEPVRQWQLETGDRIRIGNHQLEMTQLSDRSLTASLNPPDAQPVHFQQHRLHLHETPLPLCREGEQVPLGQQLKQWRPLQTTAPTLMLGGAASCGASLALTDVPHHALMLRQTDQGWVLQPGPRFSQLEQPVTLTRKGVTESLRQIRQPLTPIQGLIAGYSQFDLQLKHDRLTLTPSYRSLRTLVRPQTDRRIRQQWAADHSLAFDPFYRQLREGELPLSLDTDLLTAGALLLLTLPFSYRISQARHAQPARSHSLLLGVLTSFAVLSFLPFLFNLPPWLVLANLLTASLIWALQPVASASARQLRLLTLTLFLLGVLVQLQFALGAPQDHWFSHLNKTMALSAAACWGIMALSLWIRLHRPTLNILQLRWRGLVALTLGLLALQWLIGYEGGLGAFQPVELAKTVLILITAAALTRKLDLRNRDYYLGWFELWRSILGAVLLFLALFAVLLMQLNDHSPMVLMAFWAATMVAAYIAVAQTGAKRYLGLLAPVLLMAALITTSSERNQLQGLSLLPQSDRFAVWAQPELHPHSGYQFRTAQTMIQSGGFGGHYLEALKADQPYIENGAVMNVPALQDDFMPTFLLHQAGGFTALGLVILQCLTLCALLMAAMQFRARTRQGDYRHRAVGNFIFLALAGGVGMMGGHFIVSWGSNLGFLPVMGQPMPMLSSAGSNLILFCVPLLAAAYLCVKEQSDECD